jgi:hypothetical protein
MVHGHYGEFKVLVDDAIVVDPGAKAVLGILPSGRRIVQAVRARLEGAGSDRR